MQLEHYYLLSQAWAAEARELEESTAPWLVERRIILLARIELARCYVRRMFQF